MAPAIYAIQGGRLPGASTAIQRILRLRPAAPDRYDVEVIAERFGKMGTCGIAFSGDGKKLLLTDIGNRVIVVLRRKQ